MFHLSRWNKQPKKSPSSSELGLFYLWGFLTARGGLHLSRGGVYKTKSLSFEIHLIFQFTR
ncbi:MAG: hypothetical protein K0S79_2566 [Nitrospira sp.]|nr:hypothetical protein [Nitrospira sp.]